MARSTTQRAIVVAVAVRTGTRLHLVRSRTTVGHFIADAAVVAMQAAAASTQNDAARHVLQSTKDVVRREFPTVEITEKITTDAADTAVARLRRDALLAMAGSDDVSPAAAHLMGSTSLNVATHAACPVGAWRGVHAPGDTPVVVGVDPTPLRSRRRVGKYCAQHAAPQSYSGHDLPFLAMAQPAFRLISERPRLCRNTST
ncbi:hypothetical protein [Mycolicibacterium cosmeticum]|uniref:hypothetical protein n=1 Tax=Mycolicibacterium cosmeticum TaxID=258533 RepID=UPI0032047B4B